MRTCYGRCGLECADLTAVRHADSLLTPFQAERIAGWALSSHLASPAASEAAPPERGSPLALPAACLQAALDTHVALLVGLPTETRSLESCVFRLGQKRYRAAGGVLTPALPQTEHPLSAHCCS